MAGGPMQHESGRAVKWPGLPQASLRAPVEEAVRWFGPRGEISEPKGSNGGKGEQTESEGSQF